MARTSACGARSLPRPRAALAVAKAGATHTARHWDRAWARVAAALALGLVSTALSTIRHSPWLVAAASATGTLLVVDAWLDALRDVRGRARIRRRGMSTDRAAVTVYTLSGCLHCDRARALLRRRGIPFTEILGDGEPGFRRRLLELTGRASVPQITVDGDPVGGASHLAQLDRRGLLLPMIRREPFPRAVVVRRFNPVGLLAAPFGGTCGPWRHVVEVVERDGRVLERFPAGSGELAVLLAESLNEQDGTA